MTSITLSELTEQIQHTIKHSFDLPYGFGAEISELHEKSGWALLPGAD